MSNHKRVQFFTGLLTMMVVCALVLGSAMTPLQAAPLEATAEISFTGEELVGLPTDSSVVVNIVPDENIELYYEYGTTSGVYTAQTANSTATAGQPHEMAITGLDANTRYFYRMQYRTPGDDWVVREEHSFWTQRAPGSTFTFTIIADSHLGNMGDSGKYAQAMENVNDDHPDFHLDLGDTFMLDGLTSQSAINNRYLAQRPYMDRVGHSAPIFLASGNHENEEGWNFDDSPSQAIMSINARKLYYPTPITDGFYSGNDDTLAEIDGDHYREDYYAWEWGDALFVVLDPFQYTMSLPYSPMAGETNDEGTPTNDCWTWTLGLEQFNWFKGVLEGSDATYKFVFAHHMVGGTEPYVRGGAEPAHQYEWGGYNSNGTTWGFDTQRSGWGEDTIRDLMIDNGVDAFFHGHDHEYAYEERDGIVYQLVPSPSMSGYGFGYYSESDPYTIKVLPNSGHLRVTVTPAQATVDYVRSDTTTGGINGEVTYSYVIDGNASANSAPEAVDDYASTLIDTLVNVDVLANDSDADSDPLEVTEVSDPAHGTAVIQPDDTVNYTPDSGYTGPDSFTYTISDGNEGTDTATVYVSVTDGSSQGLSFLGGIGSASSKTTGTSLVITTNTAVAAGDDIVVAFATYGDPDYTISVSDSAGNTYEEAAQSVCYTHGRTYIFAAYNANPLPAGGTITISHTSVSTRAAVASAFSGLVDVSPLDQSMGNPAAGAEEEASGTTPSVGPTGTTAEANELLIGAIGTEGPINDAAGTWDNSFLDGPRAGTSGGDDDSNWTIAMGYRFVSSTGEYTAQKSGITDRYWAAAIATFRAEAPAENVAPVAYDQSVSTEVDTPVAITLVATDANWDSLTYAVESDPDHGTLSGSGENLTYTPDSGYTGPDSFTFSAYDGEFYSNIATVSITVTEAAPLAYLGDIGSNSSKTTGTTLAITTDTAVAAGADVIVAFSTYGDPDYTISVSDSAGNTYEEAAQAVCYEHGRTYIFAAYDVNAMPSGTTITINHTSVSARAAVASAFSGLVDVDPLDQSMGNPAPGAEQAASGTAPTVGPTGTTAEANELLIGAVGTEGPLGDAAGTWQNSFLAGPRAGTSGGDDDSNWTISMGYRIVSSTGQYTAEKSGITDRYWAAAIATFKGEAPPVNVAPVAYDQSVSTQVDTPVAIALEATDANEDVLSYAVESDPEHGTLSGTGANLIYTPDSGYVGPDGFTFSAYDGEFYSNVATVDITVTELSMLAYLGDIGSSTSKTTGTTLVITTDTAVAAGADVIVAFATYGDPDYTISVSDSAGNTYEEAAQAVCYTHGRTYIFAAYDVNAMPSGTTITINHTSVSTRAAVASAFSGLADVDPLDQSMGNPAPGAEEEASGTAPTVGPTGTTSQANELLIGAVGTEGPVGDAAGTWQNSFLAGPRAGTSGGDDTSNWTVSMGYRIVSSTGEYTASKSGITDRYWAAAIATFRGVATFDLTMAVDPSEGGTVTPDVGVHTYAAGAVVDISAVAAEGYEFDHWAGDVANPDAASTTVTMDAAKTVTAHFVEIAEYDLTMAVDPLGGGTTAPVIGVHTYDSGTVVGISAVAAEGYEFDYWEGDVADPNATSTTVMMDADKTVTAHFGLIPEYELTMAVEPMGGGTTTPAVGVHTYLEGTVVDISAEAAEGYEFGYWEGDVADSGSASTTVTMDGDKTVTAHFTMIPEYELTIAADPAEGGTTIPVSGTHSYLEGTVADISAVAAEGYYFDHWEGDVADSGSANTTVSMDGDKSVTAHFTTTPVYDLTMAVDPVGGGTTTPAVGVHSYVEGTVVDIEAVAAEGYEFDHWVGDVADTGAVTTTVTMDADKTVTAFFVDIAPPETVIAEGDAPPNHTVSTSASFVFTSEPGATFQCQLDGGGYEACTSPKIYTDLARGSHTFEVFATDSAGNPDPSPADYEWAIDWGVFVPMVLR